MKYLRQLGILFALCAAGDVLAFLTGGRLPGNVLGMTLLFVLLVSGLLHVSHIEDTADFFLQNMAFFFLPACLGLLEVYPQIQTVLLPLLLVCVLTTFLTAAATAVTVRLVLSIQQRRRAAKKEAV